MSRYPDHSPDAPYPDYEGFAHTWRHDEFAVRVDGLVFRMGIAVECAGHYDGTFECDEITVADDDGNSVKFAYLSPWDRKTKDGLQSCVMAAIDAAWSIIEGELVERAGEAR